jgi:hypothetical protein
MEEIDRMGGDANIRGIKYQIYYAIYRFLHSDTSEILLEWLDEDVIIVNEDKSAPSLEFIQCKTVGTGGLSYSIFYNDILKKFIQIFEKLRKKDFTTKYCFTIACNKGFEKDMERFSRIPKLLREGVPTENIRRVYGRTLLSKIESKEYLKESDVSLYYFLLFLFFRPNLPEEHLLEEIKKSLISFGCSKPDDDTNKILSYFMKKGSGKITKSQLRNDLKLDYPLYKTYATTSTHFKTELKPDNIIRICSEAERATTTIPTLTVYIDSLNKITNLAELTADQLTYNTSLYPIGKIERKELERSATDAIEIVSDVSKSIKELRETLGTISTKFDEIKYLRNKNKLYSVESGHESIM